MRPAPFRERPPGVVRRNHPTRRTHSMKRSPLLLAAVVLALTLSQARAQDDKALAERAKNIQSLKPSPYEPGSAQAKDAQAALANLLKARRDEVNRKSTDAWKALK